MREQERESSVASSADFYGTDSPPRAMTDAPTDAPFAATAVKRKAENGHDAQPKKLKVASSSSSSPSSSSLPLQSCKKLPPQVWQHVFLYCSLADLGRLMQVNRSFLSYLTDVSYVSPSQPDASSSLRLLKSESLWASARNALSHKPPKPLPGFTELQMWQLALGRTCQFCQKPSTLAPGERIWQKGPGATGVRVIWPFGIRACGDCLLQQCQTDASVLFSSASALRPALPFAFITDDHHYVAAYTLQSAVTPAHVQISKYYLRGHVNDIIQELEHALSLGVSAAEEWSKGLETRGKERMRHAEHWERWEARYQWHETHHDSKRTTSATTSLVATPQRHPSTSPTQKSRSPSVYGSLPTTSGLDNLHRPPTVPPQVFAPYPIRTGSAALQKNLHDANEAKTNRRTDIENRCLQMEPPIPPNVLRHMDSFKAAIQISQPMNEHAWSVLQPRLVAQLDAAQQAEADHVSRQAQQSTRTSDRRHPDLSTKEAREVMDRDWEESQRWVRDQLNSIADDFIDKEWNGSKAINYENSPKFAADLLSHVRRQFYTHIAANPDIISENAEAKSKLVLDDMKWVYDSKIKPLTEQFRKEMFLCSINDCDRNMKFYGFEGIIQHFGARHTNAFSVDKVIVAWREAEWPEATPFHADPASVRLNYGGYRPDTTTPRMHRHAFAQPSPGPHLSGSYLGPFPPPNIGTPSQTMPGIAYPPPYLTQDSNFPFQSIGPPGFGPHAGHLPYITSPAVMNTALASPPSMPAHTQSLLGNVANGTEDGHSTSSFDMQVSTVIRMARDLWKQTSGVKDMPNSLRIYVLFHRVISKFHVEFNHEPTLDHFNDALTNHDIPPALKNAPGLSCKACQLEVSRQSAGSYMPKPEERRTYTLSNLLSHFKAQHLSSQRYDPITGQPVANLDWKEDMIELPSERFISGLIHAPGMDDEKLLIIATVFPKYFPMPLPRMGASHGQSKASSPNAMSLPDAQSSSDPPLQPAKATQDPGPNLPQPLPVESPLPRRPIVEEYDPLKPALAEEGLDPETNKLTQHDLIPSERRQRYYAEPRYYMSMDQLDDGYPRRKEYVEFAGPSMDQYPGRRTAFRESERYLELPPEEVPYSHQRDGQYTRNHRQVRYYQDEEHPEYRYVRKTQSREASPTQAQTDADRFLDEFVPNSAIASEPSKPGPAHVAPSDAVDDVTKPSSTLPVMPEADTQSRSLHAPYQTAPSTVSNGSRYEDYEHSRQVPSPDMPGPSRRPGPQRRRDRHHEYRMPSRFYRYMSAAREDPMRGPSMSRSQRGRYEEQRRRINQQETPQPRLEREYEPAYSRDQSVDHVGGEDSFYQPRARDYVSVQDRLHPYSPPSRYREYEHRGPQPVYVDDFGPPVHEYEIIRVPRDPRQSRAVYHQPARYSSEQYQYVPMPYERSPPQRFENRPGEYVYYEERERDRSRPLPRRPVAGPGAPRQETDKAFESVPPPNIKVENVTPNNAGGPPPPPDVV